MDLGFQTRPWACLPTMRSPEARGDARKPPSRSVGPTAERTIRPGAPPPRSNAWHWDRTLTADAHSGTRKGETRASATISQTASAKWRVLPQDQNPQTPSADWATADKTAASVRDCAPRIHDQTG